MIEDKKTRYKIVHALLSFPTRNFSKKHLQEAAESVSEAPDILCRYADEYALNAATESQFVSPWKLEKLEKIKKTHDFLKNNYQTMNVGALLEEAVDQLDLYDEAKRLYIQKETVGSIHLMLTEFIEFAKDTGLKAVEFLQYIAELENAISTRKNFKKTEFLNLTTVHYAKGHQWEHVLIPRLERKIFPQEEADIESERRLLYVAMSRARSRITFFVPNEESVKLWIKSSEYPQSIMQKTSRFLFDIEFRKAYAEGNKELNSMGGAEELNAIELNVPYKESGQAQKLGARFNGRRGKWFLSAGMSASPFKRWM